MVVDAMGAGAGTAGWLLDQGLPVVLYKGGESSDDPTKWRCRRVQSYLVLRDRLREHAVVIDPEFSDDWDEYLAQMISVKMRPGSERVEDLDTREQMKARGIKSPDMADASAMVFATQRPRIGKRMGGIISTPGIGSEM